MNPFAKTLAPALLALLLGVTSPGASAAPVINGSFETGDLTGWTLINGSVAIRSDYGATNGTKAAILGFGNASGPNFEMSQTIGTVVGASYRVEFDWGPSPNNIQQAMYFSVRGQSGVLGGVFPTAMGAFPTPFIHLSVDFTADDLLTVFNFRDASFTSNIIDQVLDNVVVTELSRPASEVPEPGSLALVGLAIAGLAGTVRRRDAIPARTPR